MSRILPVFLMCLSFCVGAQNADSVYHNGKIYTVNPAQPWVEAIAIKEGRLLYVGDDESVKQFIGEATSVTDLGKKMVMPGIHDAHTHLLWAGLHLNYGCLFPEDSTVETIIVKLQECAKDKDPEDWLVAGLIYSMYFPDNKPHRKYLDEAFPDRPVYLREGSFHHALLNSKALALAGIDRDTEAPYGGEIIKDDNGELTGELVETATILVDPYLPRASAERNLDAMRWAVAINNAYGITSTQDASGFQETLEALSTLEQRDELTLQVAAHLIWGSPKFARTTNEALEELISNRKRYQTKHLKTEFIKIWVDGSPTPPYFTQADVLSSNEIETSKVLFPIDMLNRNLVRFDKLGLKVKLHVAGAGAARAALDAIGAARKANPNSTLRHETVHTNLITPQDMPRFKQLNAIAEMSPSVWHLVGPLLGDPPQPAWQFRALLDNGATLTVGTDWVVTPTPNLFPALEGMLDRYNESIDLNAALRALTINGAIAVGLERTHGSIEIGKTANFIVLDRNLYSIPITEISETKVLQTVFEGNRVFAVDD